MRLQQLTILGTKPLLVASTVWRNKDGEIPALLGTGCNTSIILRSLLGKLLSVDGTVPKVKTLHDATVLTAASGENMNANEFCEATLGFKGKQVVHRMYILDKLACHQKLLLGMDFMREQRLNIDMATDIITLPEVQECTPLMSMQALCIAAEHCGNRSVANVGSQLADWHQWVCVCPLIARRGSHHI